MKFTLSVPFLCPDDMTPHLQRVFDGEYDVPGIIFADPPRIIDLGANCGAFSLWASHRWPGAGIDAYEPQRSLLPVLRENLRYYKNVHIYDHAIGTPGQRILRPGRDNCGEASFHTAQHGAALGEEIEVFSPETLPIVDIIKLDIEGCEMEVLGPLIGAGRSFKLILLEYHNENLRREIDTLLARDYSLIGSEVQHIAGRGVVKYAHNSILKGLFR